MVTLVQKGNGKYRKERGIISKYIRMARKKDQQYYRAGKNLTF